MKREIKFRGKRSDNGELVYGDFRPAENCIAVPCYIRHFGIGYDVYPVDPDTVGQYTGLKDKNGAEIYEDDIITIPKIGPCIVMHGLYGWVFKSQFDKCFADGSYEHRDICNASFIFGQGQVIGNKYDNPELITITK